MNTHISHFLCTLVRVIYSHGHKCKFIPVPRSWLGFYMYFFFLLLSINVVTRDQSCESIVGKQQSGINHFLDDRHV